MAYTLLVTCIVLLTLSISTAAPAGCETPTHYDLLQVHEKADETELKRAYRAQALKWHPDRHVDKNDTEKSRAQEHFVKIVDAYETLLNPLSRWWYDKCLARNRTSGSNSTCDTDNEKQTSLFDDPFVIKLNKKNMPSKTSWLYLISYHTRNCTTCKELAPEWSQLARSLKGAVKVAALDCDDEKAVCSERGVRSFPTIMARTPSGTWQEYGGIHNASDIDSWATSLIGSSVYKVKKSPHLLDLFRKCAGVSGSNKKHGQEAAAWRLCMLLVSNSSSTPAMWKVLSNKYRGKVAFGFVASGALEVRRQLEQSGTSGDDIVITVCYGSLQTAEVFQGAWERGHLQQHIQSYEAGKRCAKQVLLDEAIDKSSLTVFQLQSLVQATGIKCPGCLEKVDYIAAARGWLADMRQNEEL